MKKAIRLISAILALALLCCACSTAAESGSSSGSTSNTASGEDGTALEPIEFEIFIPDPNKKIPPDDAPVMQQLFEKTGVRIKYTVPPTEAEERLNIMLASDDMPDLIRFDDASIMNQYIEAGKLLKLNDLLENHAPQLFNVNWESFKNRIADENGDYWYMPGNYTFGQAYIEANYGFNLRNDYLEEFGYDNVPKTMDDIKALLLKVKEWNPDIVPMGLALGPQGHLNYMMQIGAAMNGLTYLDNWGGTSLYLLDEETDTLIHYTDSPEIKAFFQFLNDLNVEGLIDPESPIMSAEMLKQKAVAEQVWSFFGPWWEINSEVNAYEASIGSLEQSVVVYPTADESIEVGTYAPYTVNMFTSGVTLTTKCKDPERYMEFIEYINTEEGWLNAQGIIDYHHTGENTAETTEGYDYIIREDELIDGKPVFEPSAWMGDMWEADENWWWNRGVECMGDFTYSINFLHKNSSYVMPPADVSLWWDENTMRINEQLGITGENYQETENARGVDVSAISGLEILSDDPAYTKLLAIQKLHETMLPRIIMAESADAFESEWNSYIQQIEEAGVDDVMAKYNELYHARMEAWEGAA